jgi:acyl-CoA synthetase
MYIIFSFMADESRDDNNWWGLDSSQLYSQTTMIDFNMGLETCRWTLLELPSSHQKSSPTNFAYSIATSGTTGFPKLIDVPLAAICTNAADFVEEFQVNEDDKIFVLPPLTFDPSLCDVFVALLAGCRLVTMSEELRSRGLEKSAEVLLKEKITYVFVTPSVLFRLGSRTLFPAVCKAREDGHLSTLLLGGESLAAPDFLNCFERLLSSANTVGADQERRTKKDVRIYNVYGLTEVSCWASVRKIQSVQDLSVLGKPLTGITFEYTKLRGRS